MGARRLALTAVVLALTATGCGGRHQPAPLKPIEEPATSTTTTGSMVAPVTAPAGADATFERLARRQQRALASLAVAQATLTQRGDAVANAGTDASKVVERIASGYAAPSGQSTPEVGRLADALAAFGSSLAPIATDPHLLPRLSAELQRRAAESVKKKPAAAGRLINVKQQVDAIIQALPRLQQAVAAAAAKARAQVSETTVDAQSLDEAIRTGADSATSALNGVNQAIEDGVSALAPAA